MSFTNAASAATSIGGRILRGPTLRVMGRTVGTVLAGGVMAATYQVMATEMQRSLDTLRGRGRLKRHRHDAIQLAAIQMTLPIEIQTAVLQARNAYRTCLDLLADPGTSDVEREALRNLVRLATMAEVPNGNGSNGSNGHTRP